MAYFHEELLDDGGRFVLVYRISSVDSLQNMLESTLADEKYKSKGDGVYERGNGVLRLLLGALHKHFKLRMTLTQLNDEFVEVSVEKATTGVAGGLVGVYQVKKELERLRLLLQEV